MDQNDTATALLDPASLAAEIPIPTATGGAPSSAPAADPAAAPAPASAPDNSTPIPGVTRDGRGVPFDPARHLAKMNPRTKSWMPRPQKGVRKGRASSSSPSSVETSGAASGSALPSSSASGELGESAASSGASSGAPSVGASGAPEASPWTDADRATAAAAGTPPAADPTAPGTAAAPAAPADAESTPEANAAVACEVVYTVTGLATGHTKEARPAAAEGAALQRATAAYFRARGWKAVGGWAIAIMAAAYFLSVFQKEGSAAALRAGWQKLTGPKRVTPTAEPRNVTPIPDAPPPPTPRHAAPVPGDGGIITAGL